MVAKEESSLLPAMTIRTTPVRGEKVSINKTFIWLLLGALVLVFGWLSVLSVITLRNTQPLVPEDFVAKLARSQEVTDLAVSKSFSFNILKNSGAWKTTA